MPVSIDEQQREVKNGHRCLVNLAKKVPFACDSFLRNIAASSPSVAPYCRNRINTRRSRLGILFIISNWEYFSFQTAGTKTSNRANFRKRTRSVRRQPGNTVCTLRSINRTKTMAPVSETIRSWRMCRWKHAIPTIRTISQNWRETCTTR